MAYYKIKSLTSKLGKRHMDKDAVLGITYQDGFKEKNHMLHPGGILYISTPSLPINIHKLRMKNLVSVSEIEKNVFMRLTNPKPAPIKEDVDEKPKKKRSYTKKSTKKEEEKEIL